MKLWRIRIVPTSLQLTPWQADTVFGSLCWMLRHREGDAALERFLKPFLDRDPPFLLSNAMPANFLPLPFSLRIRPPAQSARASHAGREAYRRDKVMKRVSYLPEAVFREVCQGTDTIGELPDQDFTTTASQLHASINRITGTTGSDELGGRLFELTGEVPAVDIRSYALYIAERKPGILDEVLPLLCDMQWSGFGKKKSSGMGAFILEGEPEPWSYPVPEGMANGFVTLSGFVPARNDPVRGFWKIQVKHGKLGEHFAVNGSPFKIPWIFLEPGSCFGTGGPPGEIYGRMLTGLTARDPRIVQYGFAFPVPMVMNAETVELAS